MKALDDCFVSDSVTILASQKKKKTPAVHDRLYYKREEVLHSLTHALGALLGVLGLILLIMKTLPLNTVDVVSAVIFGVSLILLYSASALYHGACAAIGEECVSPVRDFFMKCDHCMIFILIVGTYTPACLSAMGGVIGWIVFAVVASCSLLGLVLNSIDVDRFQRISLVLYLLTGWTIAAASIPYYKAIGFYGFMFLLAGGLLYTVGVIFYKLQRIPYMHVLWHLFVLGGSVMHFFMVYGYCFS